MNPIIPNGKSTFEESFITKMAQIMEDHSQFRVEDFSPVKHSPKFTIQLKKIALLDAARLPEGVTTDWWTSYEIAQALQSF